MSTALGQADCTLKRPIIRCDEVFLSFSFEFEESDVFCSEGMLKGPVVQSQTGVGQVAKHEAVSVLVPIFLRVGFYSAGEMEASGK